MNFYKAENNGRRSKSGRFGRQCLAMLLVLVMAAASLPVRGEAFYAYAEGAMQAAVAAAPVSDADAVQTESGADEQHICVIRSFVDHDPCLALGNITLQKATPLNLIKAMLPQKLQVVLECDDCPAEIEANWQNVGADRFELVLDAEKYSYQPLDDPETEDIDESTESPWCDLPFVSVTIEGVEPEVSASDAVSSTDVTTGSDTGAAGEVVSGGDAVSGSDTVSGGDVVSGADVGEKTPENAGSAFGSDTVSDSDAVSGSDIAVCVCQKHCYADPSEGNFSVDIRCPVCSADPTGCAVMPELEELTLQTAVDDGRTVSVTGPLPAGAVLKAEIVPEEQLAVIIDSVDFIVTPVVRFAYDITIIYEGREFQPADFGSSVKVIISDACAESGEDLAVFHQSENGIERVSAAEDGSALVFSADSFSVYVALSTDVSTIYVSGKAFYLDSGMENQLAKDGAPYTTVSDILADSTGDLTFVVMSAYTVDSAEDINPGSGRSIVLERGSGNTGNIIAIVSGGSLTLSGNVKVDGRNLNSTGALIYVNGGTLVMKDGVSVVNGESTGIMVETNSFFTMDGGLVSGNKATNGAGIYNNGNTVINGGVISGNYALHNGGGVWTGPYANNGVLPEGVSFTMNGGSITGNSCEQHHGAGLFVYSCKATVSGGTIAGNTSITYPEASGISTYSAEAIELVFTGSPRIEDNVYVMAGSHNNMVTVSGTFTPACAVKIEGDNSSGAQNIIKYSSTVAASELGKFTPIHPDRMLKTNGTYIQILNAGQAYYGGSTGGGGRKPTDWKLNFPYMYSTILKSTGGTIFMSDEFVATTGGSGVTISGTGMKVAGSNYNLNSGKIAVIKRWEKPDSLNSSGVRQTLANSLLVVSASNSTVGTLYLNNVVLDGGNRPWVYEYNGTTYNLPGVQSANCATLRVDGGATLEIQDNVVLRDAPASPSGGAIYANDGTLNIRGNITFSNNKANTYGKALYVTNAKVNIYTPTITNPENEDIYLANSSSKLNIYTNLSSVLPITINPNDTASCKPGRVIATYASGYTPDVSRFVVQNVECTLVRDGQNIVIGSCNKELTAHAEDVTPDAGESNSFTIDLAALYGGLSNVRGKNVTISNFAITSGNIVIGDYQVVEANRRNYGRADSNKYFGISAQLGEDTAQDIQAVSTTVGSAADSANMVFTVHSGNAITLDGQIATFSLELNVGGSVRYINVTLKAHSGYTISATVPIKITGVVDTSGEFFLPDGTEYFIANKGTVPLMLTDVEWTWFVDGGYDANEMFSNHENITMAVTLGGANAHDFGKTLGYQWSDISIPIEARVGDEPGRLSLDWTMQIGAGNKILSKQSATVANINYTIAVKE